jgi:hypothetical protein
LISLPKESSTHLQPGPDVPARLRALPHGASRVIDPAAIARSGDAAAGRRGLVVVIVIVVAAPRRGAKCARAERGALTIRRGRRDLAKRAAGARRVDAQDELLPPATLGHQSLSGE